MPPKMPVVGAQPAFSNNTDAARVIEHLVWGMLPLQGVLSYQYRVGCHKCLLAIGYVSRIGLSCHAPSIPHLARNGTLGRK